MNARLMLLTAAALAFAFDVVAQDDERPISIPSPSVQITGEPAPAVAVPATPAGDVPVVIPAAPALPAGPSIPSPMVQVPANPQTAPAAAASAIPAPAPAVPAAVAAVPVATPAAASALAPGEIGTTIIGDQESPIGLYITPWKDDYAERGLDRPARLLDEAMEPIDPATFRRQIEYYETITEFRRQQRGEVK
jgi:hypothetical protein